MALVDKWASKAEITAIPMHWYVVHFFRFGGFWLTQKLQCKLTDQDFDFKKYLEAEKELEYTGITAHRDNDVRLL